MNRITTAKACYKLVQRRRRVALRSRFAGHQYRTLFAFDPKQHALLLIGGDKVGQDQARFYKALIKLADAIFDRHLARIAKEDKTTKRLGA